MGQHIMISGSGYEFAPNQIRPDPIGVVARSSVSVSALDRVTHCVSLSYPLNKKKKKQRTFSKFDTFSPLFNHNKEAVTVSHSSNVSNIAIFIPFNFKCFQFFNQDEENKAILPSNPVLF